MPPPSNSASKEAVLQTAVLKPSLDGFTQAFELGREIQSTTANAVIKLENGKPFIILPTGNDGELRAVDVEHFAEVPSRIERTVTLSDADSFIRYLNDFRDEGTRIFALFGDKGGKYRAVLDYHHDGEHPRWGSHVAEYTCPTTPEWDEWIANSGKLRTQAEFSDFVEKLRLSFLEPDVATMLEIARTLEASQSGKFESKINPQNGNRTLVYKDEINATAGGDAKLSIPSTILVRLQPFRRGAHYQIEARLSYRIREGKVSFQYDLVRAHELIETALKEISASITEKTTIQPYNGSL